MEDLKEYVVRKDGGHGLEKGRATKGEDRNEVGNRFAVASVGRGRKKVGGWLKVIVIDLGVLDSPAVPDRRAR